MEADGWQSFWYTDWTTTMRKLGFIPPANSAQPESVPEKSDSRKLGQKYSLLTYEADAVAGTGFPGIRQFSWEWTGHIILSLRHRIELGIRVHNEFLRYAFSRNLKRRRALARGSLYPSSIIWSLGKPHKFVYPLTPCRIER